MSAHTLPGSQSSNAHKPCRSRASYPRSSMASPSARYAPSRRYARFRRISSRRESGKPTSGSMPTKKSPARSQSGSGLAAVCSSANVIMAEAKLRCSPAMALRLSKGDYPMTTYDNRNRGVLFSERDTKTKDDDRVSRRAIDAARQAVVEDGELYGRMRDGEALSIVGDTDVALEQIAPACGGYSEAHALLKRPLTWEDLTDAGEGIEANHSPLAEERLRDAAYRKMCMDRDGDRVQSGELSTEDY